jgi:SAM-dependent methyltransferase
MDKYTEANLAWWNEAVDIHAQGDTYLLESFKAGRFKLKTLEREEVGDVTGKSLLHLQCHFGMDTLSWARLGATVTGVDFSEKAITLARSLSSETGLDATFVQSDIYQLPQVLSGTFDIVYTSYGVIGWLPDLLPWGKIIADYLKPGGFFYIVEAHPFMWTLDEKTTAFQVIYSYFSPEPIKSEEEGTYANRNAKKVHTVTYGWNHSLSEIFMSLITAGLKIEFFHEFPFCGWENFPEMVKGEDRFFRMKDPQKENLVPMTFSLKVTKPHITVAT